MVSREFKNKLVDCFKTYLGDNLVSLVLFGSRARKKENNYSDYDIFLITEELPDNPLDRTIFVHKPIRAEFVEKLSFIAKTK